MKIIFLLFFIFSIQVQANGISLNKTRVIYNEEEKQALISVINSDIKPYSIQSWVNEESDNAQNNDFIASPSIFRSDINKKNLLRIIYTGNSLPTDRESLFWLHIRIIPPLKKDGIPVVINNVLKLIYRPEGVKGNSILYANKLIWRQHENTLEIKNPTAFYINFQEITVNGKNINNIKYIKPMDNLHIDIGNEKIKEIKWKIINDQGGISSYFKKEL